LFARAYAIDWPRCSLSAPRRLRGVTASRIGRISPDAANRGTGELVCPPGCAVLVFPVETGLVGESGKVEAVTETLSLGP
jgi:hypothetical protein